MPRLYFSSYFAPYSFARKLILALIAASLLLTPSLTLQAQLALPNMGDDTAMTLGAERELGDQIARDIYRDPLLVSDPVLDGYIASIWHPLYLQAKANGSLGSEMDAQFAWHLFLIRDKTVNAFAMPGGYFGINLGLIALSETPDELASVLAHETTHVTQRHIARGMTREKSQMPLLLGSMLIGLLAIPSNPQLANALLATGQAGAIQDQLNYSRDYEREADRIGYTLMQPAGYSPQGFIDMFDMLGRASHLADNGSFPYLRTHPLTTERIADMRNRVGQTHGKTVKLSSSSPQFLLHHLMQARASVLGDLSVDAQRFYVQQGLRTPATSPVFLATQYAAALAAWQLKDAASAKGFYERLKSATSIQTPPPVLDAVRWLGAELQLPVQLDLQSNSRVEMMYAAQQRLAKPSINAADLRAVNERLREWLSTNPKDADVWGLLSRTELLQNERIRAMIASAEQSRAQLANSAALAQYQAAQSLMRQGVPTNSVDAAIVDAKVRELQQLERAPPPRPTR